MNMVAYCRVSTDKEDQLNSLETQKEFFTQYAQQTGHTLLRIYADEGISGTRTKNRSQFLQLMQDAKNQDFSLLVVKDVSRLARNTLDLLTCIRALKSLGIETQFLTANMTSMGNSEFVLTIFAALAQEESANLSKRVKFGKHLNASKGRVPNLVYGYDKTSGDYFNLRINESEAKVIRQMYDWYLEEGLGGIAIAKRLNAMGIRTKRNAQWSDATARNVLSNELYGGMVINGKEEIADFLTGKRIKHKEEAWLCTYRPELAIVSPEMVAEVHRVRRERSLQCLEFANPQGRAGNRYLFSSLIKCAHCGRSFRRTERQYKNRFVRWVCSYRNAKGVDVCPNAVALNEGDLLTKLQDYFAQVLANKSNILAGLSQSFQENYQQKDKDALQEKDLLSRLDKLEKKRKKYLALYADDLLGEEECKAVMQASKAEMARLGQELKLLQSDMTKVEHLQALVEQSFANLEQITDLAQMSNTQLRRLVEKIEVDKTGQVDIYLKVLGEFPDSVLLRDSHRNRQN